MKRITELALVSLVTVCLCSPASADAMKPGLWSVTSTMDMGAMMPKLTPEQMAMMRKMKMKIPGIDGNRVTSQTCVTDKDRSDAMAYAATARKESGCQPRNIKKIGNTNSADIVCNGDMKGQGHSSMTLLGDREYKGTFSFKGSSKGKPIDMKTSYHGKYVSADCAGVQPVRKP